MEVARTGPPPRQRCARVVGAPEDAEVKVLLAAEQVAPWPLGAQLDACPELVLHGILGRLCGKLPMVHTGKEHAMRLQLQKRIMQPP